MARILCIDDDLDVQNLCKMALESNGHTVETAFNGDEGYDKAKSFNPELIVLDVMMQHSTEGFHTAYKFREDKALRYVPILMLTSVNQKMDLKFDSEKDGAFIPVDRFIEKPIKEDELNKVATELLNLDKSKINVDGK